MSWMIYGANGYTGELAAREAVRTRARADPRRTQRRGGRARWRGSSGLESRAFSLDDPQGTAAELVRRQRRAPLRRPVRPHQRADGRGLPRRPARTTSTSPARSRSSRRSWPQGEAARKAGRGPAPRRRLRRRPERLPGRPARRAPCRTPPSWSSPSTPTARQHQPRHPEDDDREPPARRGASAATARSSPCRSPSTPGRSTSAAAGRRWAMTIPWGDVSTAFHSTGIPNIRVYSGTPPAAIRRMKRLAPLLPLAGWGPVKRLALPLGRPQGARPPGGDAGDRPRLPLGRGEERRRPRRSPSTLETPEGYRLTAVSAVEQRRAGPGEGCSPAPGRRRKPSGRISSPSCRGWWRERCGARPPRDPPGDTAISPAFQGRAGAAESSSGRRVFRRPFGA